MNQPGQHPVQLVDPEHFLLAVRDAGYRTPAAAVAELVDNSLEAHARTIEIQVSAFAAEPLTIEVADDGDGMTADEMRLALVFGGSTRFGNRRDLGRFGMGLPAASLSLARRVTVESWRGAAHHTVSLSLDDRQPLGDVTSRRVSRRPATRRTGTAVRLIGCDRLGYRRRPALLRHLETELGRIFREPISHGLKLTLDGHPVRAHEHLALEVGSQLFGDELRYRLSSANGDGTVRVRFSELPVLTLWDRSSNDKANLGVLSNSPVSVLRHGREIDRGWWFMGGKRRENYDSWWRCEVDFDPVLDEMFGVTFTKQQVTPTRELQEVLGRDLEPIARALNARVRANFELAKLSDPIKVAERVVKESAPSLPPRTCPSDLRIELAQLDTTAAVSVSDESTTTVVRMNANHPFVRDLYQPLAQEPGSTTQAAATRVVLVAVAYALTTATSRSTDDWDSLTATFLERSS